MWVGYDAIVMHGVKIGEGAIVAVGVIVTKDVAPYTIVGGILAKKTRDRFTRDEQQIHREALGGLRRTLH